MERPPYRDVEGLLGIMAGLERLLREPGAEIERDLQRVTADIAEGWEPWNGVWVRSHDAAVDVAVWATDSSNDRVSDEDARWIEKKFAMCVLHLEYFFGPATLGSNGNPGNGLHRFVKGRPACARWEQGKTNLYIYLEHEDADLPIVLFARAADR